MLSQYRIRLLCVTLLFQCSRLSVNAWYCSFNITGDQSGISLFSNVSAACHSDITGEQPYAALVFDESLLNASASSYQVEGPGSSTKPVFHSLGDQLVLFNLSANTTLTLHYSHIINVNADATKSIIAFSNPDQVIIDNLSTSGCLAPYILLASSSAAHTSSSVTLQNSYFGYASAGGISARSQNLSVHNTVFDGFTDGDAIHHNNTGSARLEVTNCSFTDLDSAEQRCAIVLTRADARISDCNFTRCDAWSLMSVSTETSSVQQSSANETVTVDGCTFVNNTAKLSLAYMAGMDDDPQQSVHLYNSHFTGNHANQTGGVSLKSMKSVTVQGCTFENITVPTGLGALYVYGSAAQVTFLTVRDTHFVANNGTRLFSPASETVSVLEITSSAECGGLYALYCDCVGVVGSEFSNNTGTGLSVHSHGSTLGRCTEADPVLFHQSTIDDSADDLAAFATFMGDYNGTDMGLDIRNSSFTNNSAESADSSDVSTVYSTGGAGLDVLNVEFSIISGCIFESNNCRQGAGLNLDTCLASIIYNCSFQQNSAHQQGGGIAFVSSHAKGLLVFGSQLYSNTAGNGAGIFGDAGANITISSTELAGNSVAQNGSAVACDRCQGLYVQSGSNIYSNFASWSGAGCYCNDCGVFQADGVTFKDNSAAIGAAIAADGTGTYKRQVNLSNSVFQSNNASTDGGAVYLSGGENDSWFNNFINNTSLGRGGAITYMQHCYTTSSMSSPNFWVIVAGEFCSYLATHTDIYEGNQAGVAGGVIYSTDAPTTWLHCQDSSAPIHSMGCSEWTQENPNGLTPSTSGLGYGPEVAFPAQNITLASDPNEIIKYISDGISPLPLPPISLIDQAGQFVQLQGLQATLSVTNATAMPAGMANATLANQVSATADKYGLMKFNNTVLLGAPLTYNLTVAVPEVNSAFIYVEVWDCGRGQSNVTSQQCSTCLPNQFSVNNSKICHPCPTGALCSGGVTLVPQNGSWHSSAVSDYMVSCPNPDACQRDITALQACQNLSYVQELPAAPSQTHTAPMPQCLLNWSVHSYNTSAYMQQLCKPGYWGPMCSLCVKDPIMVDGHNVTFGRNGPLKCRICRSSAVIVLTYIASSIVVLLWLSYTVHVTLHDNEEAARGNSDPGRTAQLIRAFNLWLQYITLLGGVSIPAPKAVQVVFSAASLAFNAVASGILSLDCLLSASEAVNPAVQGLFIHLALPLVMLVILCLLQVLWWHRAQRQAAAASASTPAASASSLPGQLPSQLSSQLPSQFPTAQLKRRLLITFLEVTFFYYSSLLTTSLQLFACFHIDLPGSRLREDLSQTALDSGKGYWVPDMNQECYKGWHALLVGLLGTPMIALTWIIIPLLPAYLLWRRRGRLDDADVKLQYGYIYQHYRKELRFWNSVVLGFTLCLAAAQVFPIAINAYFQLTIMLMVLLVDFAALTYLRPFEDDLMQGMQVFGKFAVVATATGCLYFMDTSRATSEGPHQGLQAVGILLLLLNLAYVGATLILVTKTSAHKGRSLARISMSMISRAAGPISGILVSTAHKVWRFNIVAAWHRGRRGQGGAGATDLPVDVAASTGGQQSFSGGAQLHRRVSQRGRAGEADRADFTEITLLNPTSSNSSAPADGDANQRTVLAVLPHEQNL